jgi:hypothetical protein
VHDMGRLQNPPQRLPAGTFEGFNGRFYGSACWCSRRPCEASCAARRLSASIIDCLNTSTAHRAGHGTQLFLARQGRDITAHILPGKTAHHLCQGQHRPRDGGNKEQPKAGGQQDTDKPDQRGQHLLACKALPPGQATFSRSRL